MSVFDWVLILVAFFLCLLPVWGYFSEKKTWNNGVDATTGGLWIRFDVDSHGGRGYRNQEGTRWIWISYPVDSNYTATQAGGKK